MHSAEIERNIKELKRPLSKKFIKNLTNLFQVSKIYSILKNLLLSFWSVDGN